MKAKHYQQVNCKYRETYKKITEFLKEIMIVIDFNVRILTLKKLNLFFSAPRNDIEYCWREAENEITMHPV